MPRPTPIVVPSPSLPTNNSPSTGGAALEGLAKIITAYKKSQEEQSQGEATKALLSGDTSNLTEDNYKAISNNPTILSLLSNAAMKQREQDQKQKEKQDLQTSLENFHSNRSTSSYETARTRDEGTPGEMPNIVNQTTPSGVIAPTPVEQTRLSLKTLGLLGGPGEQILAKNTAKAFTDYLSNDEKAYFGIPAGLNVSKEDFKEYIPKQSSDAWKIVADKNSPTGFSHTNVSTGKIVPNAPVPSSGTTVNVNTGKKVMETLAGGIGTDIMTTKQAAIEATKTISAAHQIKNAVDNGGVILGPGATLRTKGAQISQMFGFSGDNAVENTRNAIQGLAKLSLGARQQLKGQGQISDKESELLVKAESGDISDLTVPEIKIIADIAERGARLAIKRNKTNQDKLSKNPDAQGITDFLTVDEPPPYKSSAKKTSKQTTTQQLNKIGRFNVEVE